MKKKIIGAALIAAMAVAAGWSYNQSKQSVEMSDLALANVEALAQSENGGGYSCSVELQCCGINSNKKVSCTGNRNCISLKDFWGYPCEGVECDGKKTTC